jgi:protein-L-isoaspartate(D-aspartate) O-methyltransferase
MADEGQRSPGNANDMLAARRVLLEEIAREVAWSGIGDGGPELDQKVRDAMLRVPRERFLPPELWPHAHDNQPLIVAVMTQLLRLDPSSRVLEVGTGSGYQTAILAELAAEVVTVEVVEALAADAKARLEALGYRNVEFHIGDGAAGWAPRAPYDGILVTAATPGVPPALLEQLKPGGRLVIPLGRDTLSQELVLVEKDQAGNTEQRALFPVAFVPLTGGGPGR